jgi:hypothetical protein
MVQIAPEWDEESRVLALTFPDGARVEGTVELGRAVEAVMYRHPHPSRRVVGPWEAAISEFVGEPLTLLWAESHAVDRGYRGGTISLVSRGSLERLGREAEAPGPVDGRRFRMLFEIDGVAPHAEDDWLDSQVRIGEATIQLNGDVGRCVVTSHDPDRGVTDLDTLGTLARYRREGRDEDLPFGVYGTVAVPGRVRLGDPGTRQAHGKAPTRANPRANRRRRSRLVLREHRGQGGSTPRRDEAFAAGARRALRHDAVRDCTARARRASASYRHAAPHRRGARLRARRRPAPALSLR